MTAERDSKQSPWQVALSVALVLLVIGWLSAPLWFFYGAIAGIPFYGETPDADRSRLSRNLITMALVCWIGLPALGLFLAAGGERTKDAIGFGAVLAVGVLIAASLGLLTPSRINGLWNSYFPPAPPTSTYPDRPCVNYSGGDAECPGG